MPGAIFNTPFNSTILFLNDIRCRAFANALQSRNKIRVTARPDTDGNTTVAVAGEAAAAGELALDTDIGIGCTFSGVRENVVAPLATD